MLLRRFNEEKLPMIAGIELKSNILAISKDVTNLTKSMILNAYVDGEEVGNFINHHKTDIHLIHHHPNPYRNGHPTQMAHPSQMETPFGRSTECFL